MNSMRKALREIIFEAETPKGYIFDICLLLSICLSILCVILESVDSIRNEYGDILRLAEWAFTIFFTIEYLLRIICVDKPWRYLTSFYGIVDLMAIIPTYLSLVVTGTQSLLVVRSLRLLRVFRVFKLVHFVSEAEVLKKALKASRQKITVFLWFVAAAVVIIGSLMYIVEDNSSGFTSIPVSMYWAVVTMTTVGYGDITPASSLGKFIASLVMVLGYGVIAVPTGIVTAEVSRVSRTSRKRANTRTCDDCFHEGHEAGAHFCLKCGAKLDVSPPEPNHS